MSEDSLISSQRAAEARRDTFVINSESGRVCVKLDEILYCESRNRSILFHMADGRCIWSRKMRTAFPQQMQPFVETGRFCRCHQSFYVSLPCIDAASGNELILHTGEHLPVSKSHRAACFAAYYDWVNRYGFLADSTGAVGSPLESGSILDRLGCAITVWTQVPNDNWYLKYVNNAYCELMKSTRCQVLEQAKDGGLYRMVHPGDLPMLDRVEKNLTDGQHLHLKYRLLAPDGKVIPGFADVQAYQKTDGGFLLYIAYMVLDEATPPV